MTREPVDLLAALLRTMPTVDEPRHQERMLNAIGSARTDAEFAVAWRRWYFDDEGER